MSSQNKPIKKCHFIEVDDRLSESVPATLWNSSLITRTGLWPGNCTKVCRNRFSAMHTVQTALHTVAFPTCSALPTL